MSDKYSSQRHTLKVYKSNYKVLYIGITDSIILQAQGERGLDEAEGEKGGSEGRRKKIRQRK